MADLLLKRRSACVDGGAGVVADVDLVAGKGAVIKEQGNVVGDGLQVHADAAAAPGAAAQVEIAVAGGFRAVVQHAGAAVFKQAVVGICVAIVDSKADGQAL